MPFEEGPTLVGLHLIDSFDPVRLFFGVRPFCEEKTLVCHIVYDPFCSLDMKLRLPRNAWP